MILLVNQNILQVLFDKWVKISFKKFDWLKWSLVQAFKMICSMLKILIKIH